MTEPIYHYTKGEGWSIQTCESAIVTTKAGVVRFEIRKPNEGEIYINGPINWGFTQWENWVIRSSYAFKNSENKRFPQNQACIKGPDDSFCVLTWLT